MKTETKTGRDYGGNREETDENREGNREGIEGGMEAPDVSGSGSAPSKVWEDQG